MSALTALARRITRVERELRRQRTPQLSHSSVEGGTLDFNDEDGNLGIVVGQQPDGTNAPVVVSGPAPPTPAGVSVGPWPNSLMATWDGTWVGDGVAPLDFTRVEIHASTTGPDFVPDLVGPAAASSTLRGTIESSRGGRFPLFGLGYDADVWVKFVARSAPGKWSDPTDAVGPNRPQRIQTEDLAPDAVDSTKIADFSLAVTKFNSRQHLIH